MYIFRYDNEDELDMSIYQLGRLIDIAKRNSNVRQIVRNNPARDVVWDRERGLDVSF